MDKMDDQMREYLAELSCTKKIPFGVITVILSILIVITTVLSFTNQKALKTLKNGLDSQIEDPATTEWRDSVIVNDMFMGNNVNLARYNIEWDNHDYIIMYEAREFEDGIWRGKMVNVIHDPDCSCEDHRDYLYDILDAITTDYD